MTTETPEAVPVEKPRMRQSNISTFLKCGMRYYHDVIRGIKRPPNSALAFGSSFHSMADTNYAQKIETHEDLPTGELKERFVDAFEKRADDIEWTAEEKIKKIDVVTSALLTNGEKCVELYQDVVAEHVQPVSVEHTFRISLGDDFPYDLGGTLDLLADVDDDYGDQLYGDLFRPTGDVIIDHKTAGKSPGAAAGDESLQLSIYTLGYRVSTGRIERGACLDHIVKTKTPKIVQRPTMRTDKQLDTTLILIGRVAHQIEYCKKTGDFVPTEQSNWWCSSAWCGYWHICEFGGKK